MRQAGMRSLSPQHTHRPARVSGKGEVWNGRCVFRLNRKWYDAAMNVVVIHRIPNYYASNVERHLCKQRVSFDQRGVSSTLKKTVTSTR
jgi:hypothetical protein